MKIKYECPCCGQIAAEQDPELDSPQDTLDCGCDGYVYRYGPEFEVAVFAGCDCNPWWE